MLSSRAPRAWTRAGRTVRRMLSRVAAERSSPFRIGLAVAVGVFIGTTPFIGLHTPISLVVATLFGLNRMVTYLASNVSLPPAMPFIIFGAVQLGSFATTGRFLGLSFEDFLSVNPYDFLFAWGVGSVLLGTLLGAPAGLVASAAVRGHRRRHPLPPDPVGDAMAALVRRYRGAGRRAERLARRRYANDWIYRWIYRHLGAGPAPSSPVLDLGCRNGQAGLLLRHLHPRLSLIGLEPREAPIAWARVVAGEDADFRVADLREAELPRAGTVLLIDALSRYPAGDHAGLVSAAAAAVGPGGTLVVCDLAAPEAGQPGERGSGRIAILWARAARFWAGEGGGPVFPCAFGSMTEDLRARGLEVERPDGDGDVLSARQLLVGRRPVASTTGEMPADR